ncbi:MAG: HXXEE domain-containing protein [Vicinamibacterales bacterium]
MNDAIRSFLVGTAGLDAALLAAVWLTVVRPPRATGARSWRTLGTVAAVALACHALHFGEELVTGFPRRFPELVGLAPWPTALFVGFNVAWIAGWAASAWAVRSGTRVAFFPLWFLGLASAANGVAHLALAFRVGGYFPGLATSPIVGIAGVVLLRRLVNATG